MIESPWCLSLRLVNAVTPARVFGAQHHAVAFDHAGRLEPLQPPADLRRRQRHLLAELLMRRAAEALQHVQQREIEVIEFQHEHSPH